MKKEIVEACIARAQKKIGEIGIIVDEKRTALFELSLAKPNDYEMNRTRMELYQEIREFEALLGRIRAHLSLLENLLTSPSPTSADLGSLAVVKDCQDRSEEVYLIIPKPEVFCVRPSVGQSILCCMSPNAPFCKAMLGKKVGAKFKHQGRTYEVVQVE